jgi:hypothetical protein
MVIPDPDGSSGLMALSYLTANDSFFWAGLGGVVGAFRLPGPVCQFLGALDIDTGTMCLATAPSPGPVSVAENQLAKRLQPATGTAHVLGDPETYIGNDTYSNAKGNHECVEFARQVGGAPHTSLWRPGALVQPREPIAKGTWVATFVGGGYEGHVGAFESMDSNGNLTLIDQFNSRGRVDRTTYHVKQQPYTGRISNDPSQYHVVLW